MKKTIKKKILKRTARSPIKSLGGLMNDEDGFVKKETILKVGLSTIAALGVVGALSETNSTAQLSHSNTIGATGGTCISHTNVTTHSSY